MPTRVVLFVAGVLVCGCAAPRVTAPARVDVVPCGEPAAAGETTVVGRRAVFVGDTVVVAGEAKGAFVIDGKARRCPSSPSVLVLGLDRRGASRFAWCVSSPAPFPSLAITPGGFAVAGRIARDAGVERPVDAASPAAPSTGAEEVAALGFAADGTYRGRVTIAKGPGSVAALAALPDGELILEGSAVRPPLSSLVVEHFLVRVDASGGVVDLQARKEIALGSPPVDLVPRPGGGLFRAAVQRDEIVVEVLGDGGARELRVHMPMPGTVVDLVAAAGASNDEVWLAWSARLGRGEPARWQRRIARVGKGGNVNERSLGHEDVNAHVYGLVPLGADSAAVLFQVWKERGQRARFGALELDARAEIATGALVAYDVPGTREVALAAVGDDVVALGVASEPGAAALTGWFRGALRGAEGVLFTEQRCGLFVGTVAIGEERWP